MKIFIKINSYEFTHTEGKSIIGYTFDSYSGGGGGCDDGDDNGYESDGGDSDVDNPYIARIMCMPLNIVRLICNLHETRELETLARIPLVSLSIDCGRKPFSITLNFSSRRYFLRPSFSRISSRSVCRSIIHICKKSASADASENIVLFRQIVLHEFSFVVLMFESNIPSSCFHN